MAKKRDSLLARFLKVLGPGLVTGASDDDPSGIATYAQAGAVYGLSTLWTALITFPLMAAVQEMCARTGMATRQGLTGVIKKHYPRWVLLLMLLFSFPAIIMNIGADIAGMGAVANLIFPSVSIGVFSIGFTVLLGVSMVMFPYRRIAAVLKYLAIVLLVYLIVPFFTHVDLKQVISNTFIPNIKWNKDYMGILVGILGTTISPYLFFWQADMEVEDLNEKRKSGEAPKGVNSRMYTDMRIDVNFGMLFSNVVMYFIILTTGCVLAVAGVHHIDTVEQAALALKPLAGNVAYYLFAVGVIGTGFLAIPVLSGTLSYIISETFGWSEGLDKKFYQAKRFYIIIGVSMVVGLLLNNIGMNPVQELLFSAILYGVTAPVIIAIILHICNNKKIMGARVNKLRSNVLGGLTLLLMTAAAVGLLYQQFF